MAPAVFCVSPTPSLPLSVSGCLRICLCGCPCVYLTALDKRPLRPAILRKGLPYGAEMEPPRLGRTCSRRWRKPCSVSVSGSFSASLCLWLSLHLPLSLSLCPSHGPCLWICHCLCLCLLGDCPCSGLCARSGRTSRWHVPCSTRLPPVFSLSSS